MTTMAQAVGMGYHGTMAAPHAAAGRESVARNVLLFLAAPWIGLAYIVAFPVVGMVAMVRMARR